MKYSIKNFEVKVKNEAIFHVENIDIEYNVQELKQFAENGALLLNTIKSLVSEVTPIIGMEIEKQQTLKHSFCMEQTQADREAENEKQSNWRERHNVNS